MASLPSKTSSSTDSPSPDCSSFLNWDENEEPKTVFEKIVVFRSLVATVKNLPALDVSVEAKAVKFLESLYPKTRSSANDFLLSLGRTSDDSLTSFIQSIVVLVSSTNQTITTAAMEMVGNLSMWCSARVLYLLFKADLFPQLINTLNLQSLSFAGAVDIHNCLMNIICNSIYLSTPNGLEQLEIEEENEQEDVHETVLQHVLTPSEKYIWHLCVFRFSLIDENQSYVFVRLLARLLETCPYHQPTMDFILHMPVVLTIPSCLTFFEHESSIWYFLYAMIKIQQKGNEQKGEVRQMWKKVLRRLRMEGFEDSIEEKLRNDAKGFFGDLIVDNSIKWNKMMGMNLLKQE
ncbi:hypothetical protein BLNAU_12001 [Blattamonas nauphoetae]|uniref:Uncharacterized protein n=1 Tax=Blattamonas nauphoetae TaxID=2049346 RepID=A0ABQ9XNQ4_9EUKA|nr:hypothetical protein BLNAU_12001 [Blattamonas nauphoetae]